MKCISIECGYDFALSHLRAYDDKISNIMINACATVSGFKGAVKTSSISADICFDERVLDIPTFVRTAAERIFAALQSNPGKCKLKVTIKENLTENGKSEYVDTYVDVVVCVSVAPTMNEFNKRLKSSMGELLEAAEKKYNPDGSKNISVRVRFLIFGDKGACIRTPFMEMKRHIYDVEATLGYITPASGDLDPYGAYNAFMLAERSNWTLGSERYIFLFSDTAASSLGNTDPKILRSLVGGMNEGRERICANEGQNVSVNIYSADDDFVGFFADWNEAKLTLAKNGNGLLDLDIPMIFELGDTVNVASQSTGGSDEIKEDKGETSSDTTPEDTPLVKKDESNAQRHPGRTDRAPSRTQERASRDLDNGSDENPQIKPLVAKADEIRRILLSKVMGQGHAVSAFVEGYFGMELFRESPDKRKAPKGLFLFAGPPGVGKTFLAESAAELCGKPFLRVDMSEYAERESICNFNGIHPSYKDACEGKVTGFVKANPDCILLFDEIEKAHLSIIHLFLQILDGGRVRDVFLSEEISFRNAIIIMTTNAGRNLYEDATQTNLSGITEKSVLNALKTDVNAVTGQPFFPTAIVSRLARGRIIMFNHLEPFALRDIVAREIREQISNFEKLYNIEVALDDKAIAAAILYAGGGASDARTLKGMAKSFVIRELLDFFEQYSVGNAPTELDALKKLRIAIDTDSSTPDAKALFVNESLLNVLLLCDKERAEKIASSARDNVNFVCVQSLEAAKAAMRGDISFAVVDPLCGFEGGEFTPSDLEDIESVGMSFFRYALECYVEIPLYVLDTNEKSRKDGAYVSLLRAGARGIIPCHKENSTDFHDEVETLRSNVVMSSGAYKLARSSKILSYNCAQLFSGDGVSAEIRLQRLCLRRAVSAEDNADILSVATKPNVRFSDVIGATDAKQSLADFIKYLASPAQYIARGAKAPRGVLLYGPPGTGKTLLAKAVAGEADVAFIQKNATEFFKSYVGEGPKAIRDVFKTARRYAPSIIFIDEIDAFAKMRTGGESGRPAEELLNTFLSELDGFVFDEKRPVFVLAATNYDIDASSGSPRTLDPAFVRRFDRKIKIELPNVKEREQFIRYYLSKHGVDTVSDQAIENLALRAYGRSPADLEMVVAFAIREAHGEPLTDEMLGKALDADKYGAEREWSLDVIKQTTFHEAGHTVVSWFTGKKPSYVTNISRGNFGGYMLPEIDDGKFGSTRQELLDDICCSMGGRAAEIVFYGNEKGLTTGASGDLRSASATARDLICTYGMDDKLGFAVIGARELSGEAETALRARIGDIINEQFERAVAIIREHSDAINALVDELMRKNSLTAAEIAAVLEKF